MLACGPLSGVSKTPRRTFLLLPLLMLPIFAHAQEILTFEGLYKSVGILGIKYSERALNLRGQSIRLRGYMAPPLKSESRFFVLTRDPVSVCPFCSSDAEWPVDIVVVHLKKTLTRMALT